MNDEDTQLKGSGGAEIVGLFGKCPCFMLSLTQFQITGIYILPTSGIGISGNLAGQQIFRQSSSQAVG